MAANSTQVSLSELLRLAFPAGTTPLGAEHRDQIVNWVVMAGAGVTPAPGDFVLCGTPPTKRDLNAWARLGAAGAAMPAQTAAPAPAGIGMPLVVLPEGASLRDIQRAALDLIVNRQSYLAERGAQVAQTLTRLTLEGAGLDGLARAIHDLTGKTVVVQDKRLQPLAEAVSTGMSHVWAEVRDAISSPSQLPDGLRDRRQAASLAGWRDQSLPGGLMRLVCPIVAKGMARGYLSVIALADDLDALDQLVVEYGAAACALEMAKAKAVSDAEKRAHGDFLDAVLTGSLPVDELVRWASRIRCDVETPHAAVTWRWGDEPGGPSMRRLETLVNQAVVHQGANALVQLRGSDVIVFCGVAAIDKPEAALALAASIRRAAAGEYPQIAAYCGIGRPAGELLDWKDSYRESSQALSMAIRLREGSRPLYFGNLSVYRLLFQLEGNPELEAFCREALGPLLEYEGGGDLLETLEAFCERLGNLSQTAEKLFIHRNSLLYRMERISQIAGLDMNNPDTRLAVHLALKVRKMLFPTGKRREK